MNTVTKNTGPMNVVLWLAQILLAASFIWAVTMKWFRSPEQLASMWPWTADHQLFVKATCLLDLLAGLGLVLPAALHIRPRLTVYAAWGAVSLMIAAIVFHVSGGEAAQTGINVVFALMAIFIARGRAKEI